jgi:hypothetical protein
VLLKGWEGGVTLYHVKVEEMYLSVVIYYYKSLAIGARTNNPNQANKKSPKKRYPKLAE